MGKGGGGRATQKFIASNSENVNHFSKVGELKTEV